MGWLKGKTTTEKITENGPALLMAFLLGAAQTVGQMFGRDAYKASKKAAKKAKMKPKPLKEVT